MDKRKKIRLMFVDDHQILIDGMKALLKNNSDFEIAGEAVRCEKALELIPLINPDIIISDINLPGMSGIEFAKIVHRNFPAIKILALSVYSEKGMITQMLDAGVSGYMIKNTGKEELVEALKKIYGGGMYFSNEVSVEILKNIAESRMHAHEEKKASLSPREKEILKLIVKEYSNKKIAETLFISEYTVETHRKNIFRKTDTKSLVGLIKYAIENKLD